jgi:glutamine synthetase
VTHPARAFPHDLAGATSADIIELATAHHVRFLRLQFSDILGVNKNVEIPVSRLDKALAGDVLFDGSSIEGFVRSSEADMLLRPDLSTFRVFPWGDPDQRVGRLICDIVHPDGTPFAGDPRGVLRRQLSRAADVGYGFQTGVEVEFFLFKQGPDGGPSTTTHDVGSYFDLTPVDLGEEARRAIVGALEQMGFAVEAAHHEVAPGQHEIDLRVSDALRTADDIVTLRFVVRNVAQQFGLHASFMPKPLFGHAGSGLHIHQSLTRDGVNVFADTAGDFGLSATAHRYIGGLLAHARGLSAITNPLVNSYKRLVPGFEAPMHVAWALKHRSPLVRVPARRGPGTRVELRSPDPATNPYLALAVMLAAGLDGIEQDLSSREPVESNIAELSFRERRRLRIDDMPRDLNEACDALESDPVVCDALGDHVTRHYLAAKRQEWQEYGMQVSSWELARYLGTY